MRNLVSSGVNTMLAARRGSYAPAPVDWMLTPTERANASRYEDVKGFGLRGTYGTFQEWTFLLSLAAQLGVLILSGIAFGQWNTMHPILRIVLLLETAVQGVEFCWYSTIGVLYLWGKFHIGTDARYYDWAITTPVMLLTLMFYALWESDNCLTTNDLVAGRRAGYVVIIVVCDWIMLLFGYAYANENARLMQLFDTVPNKLFEACCTKSSRVYPDGSVNSTKPPKNLGIYLGWIPFVGAFTPLFVMFGEDSFKSTGRLSIGISFGAWALYGVVAVMTFFHDSLTEEQANTAYNVLDIVSKNVLGVVVSLTVLNNNATTSEDCAAPPMAPPATPPVE